MRCAKSRLAWALVLAALVHVGLLALPVDDAERQRPVPLRARLVPPPTVASEPAPRRPIEPRRISPSDRSAAVRTPEPPAAVEAPPSLAAPSSIDLFPTAAIGRVAAPPAPEAVTDEQLFGRRMARWTEDFHARERVSSGQTPRAVAALGARMWMWYLPGGELLARRAPAGLGAASSIVPLIDYYTSGRANHPSDAMANTFGDRRHIDPTGRTDMRQDYGFVACFGQCNDLGHEVARLETTVVIQHDETGRPKDWSVARTSGDRDFDGEALSAVGAALELTPAEELRADLPPRRTDWIFRVIAYRWTRAELMDPLFIPPGQVLEAYSGISGKTTMVREVRLVALR